MILRIAIAGSVAAFIGAGFAGRVGYPDLISTLFVLGVLLAIPVAWAALKGSVD